MFVADTFSPTSIFDYIQSGGIIAVLVFVIIGGAKRWWVFGWQYKELLERCEKVQTSNEVWMNLALRGVNVTERIIGNTSSADDKGVKDDLSDW